MSQRLLAGAVLGAALGALSCGPAQAQADFPTRPITLVVPFPAGGTADLLCRYAGEKASAGLGQQVVIENRPGGAGGRVGIEQVLRARRRTATRCCAGTQLSYSITHLVFSKASVRSAPARADQRARDLSADHHPRARNLPANNLKEFIDYAKANPGKVNYGNQGKANTGHLLGELMMLKGSFKMTAGAPIAAARRRSTICSPARSTWFRTICSPTRATSTPASSR